MHTRYISRQKYDIKLYENLRPKFHVVDPQLCKSQVGWGWAVEYIDCITAEG